MNTPIKAHKKLIYITPEIFKIELDNDISLILASDAEPEGEPSWSFNAQENNNNSPYGNQI